jgi:hypothetical protein
MVEIFPDTATTRTQGGGQHLIYVAPDGPVGGGTHKLGPGIDIQAHGKYVVMPGSTIEGRMYARENARPPSFAPPWLVERLKAAKAKTDAAGKRIVEEDEISLEMARNYIQNHAPRAQYGKHRRYHEQSVRDALRFWLRAIHCARIYAGLERNPLRAAW